MSRDLIDPRRLFASALVTLLAVTLMGCGSSGPGSTDGDADRSPDAVAGSADFGTMKDVCHEATGENVPGEHGVTADSVRVTTISDAGSDLQPGLLQELWDASRVFTRWCNEHGGINGRKIEMVEGDAQLIRYGEVIDQACKDSFALVGGGGAMDNTAEEARTECGLISVPGFLASREARRGELAYPAMASGVRKAPGGALRYLKDRYGGDEPVALVYGDFETTLFTGALKLRSAIDIGLASADSPVNTKDNTYPITGRDDWGPVAAEVYRSGAQGVLFSGQSPDLGKLMTSLAANKPADSALEWVLSDENVYDQAVIRSGLGGIDEIPLYVQAFIHPFEEAGKGERSRAMDDYLALFEHYLPDGRSDAMLGVYSFAAWLLFAQAASACGDELTRQCLEERIETTGLFDAGGLIAPRDPKDATESSECFVLMQATTDGFQIVRDADSVQPTDDGRDVFNCGQNNIVTVDDRALESTMSDLEALAGGDPDAGAAAPG